jgi:AcrR family transcriptional regulator
MGKKSYHHPDLRQRLLDEALAIIREDGIKGLTLRNLASRAGVSRGAPYRHFSGKDEIIARILLEGHKRLKDRLQSARDGKAGPAAGKIAALGRAYVDFAHENPERLKVMFTKEGLFPAMSLSSSIDASEVSDADSFGVLVAAVRECQAQGSLDPGLDPELQSLSIWAEVHGLAVLRNEGVIANMAQSRGLSEESVLTALLEIAAARCGKG